MTFKPGQSGNPSGRPKAVREVMELARQFTEEAIKGLVQIARESESDPARVGAWKEVIDRGWGKAPAFNTADAGEFRDALGMSDDELDRDIERTERRIAQLAATQSKAEDGQARTQEGTPKPH